MSQSHIKLHAFKDKTIFSLLSKQFLLLYSQDYSYILTCQKMLGKFSALSYPFFFLVSKLLPRHISDHSQTVLDSTHLTKFKFHFLCSKHQNSLTWVLEWLFKWFSSNACLFPLLWSLYTLHSNNSSWNPSFLFTPLYNLIIIFHFSWGEIINP